jgi:hypothetical protein
MNEELILGWVGVIYTIFVLSILFKDNVFFRLAENIILGAAAGHWTIMAVKSVTEIAMQPILTAGGVNLLYIFPMILGVFFYASVGPQRYRWISRYPVAFVLGVGTALALRTVVQTQILAQVSDTIFAFAGNTAYVNINNLVILITTVCTLLYFILTVEQKGPLRIATRIGRFSLMIAFGASFAWWLAGFFPLIIERISTVLRSTLGVGY